MGVITDVGTSTDDGHALQPRQRHCEGNADVGANPKKSSRGHQGRDVDRALRLRNVASGQHAGHVRCNVDVLNIKNNYVKFNL